MALKERFQNRVDSMKVEGEWWMKVAVYGGAVAVVGFILLVMYLLLGSFGSGPPSVGTVTLKSGGQEYVLEGHQIYTTQGGDRTESSRLVPGEVGDSAHTVVFDHSTTIGFEGGSDNGDFAFTIYDEQGREYAGRAASFQCPQEPGTYLVCEECYWGTNRRNIGMEYYFWIEVTQDYLTEAAQEE